MNRCIYCNKKLGTADLNNVCSECANARKETHITTQPIILSRVYFSETYPTVDEIIEALKDFFKNSKYHNYIDTVYYSEKDKYFYTEDENRNLVEMIFDNYYVHEIPPHLITLIGRFYEGLEVKE